MSEPIASGVVAPGYGDFLGTGDLLPWSWAEERLAASHNYWVATTRPDRRPHAMPVWAVWLDCRLLFSTGPRSRKARNLAANAACSITTESAADAVIVEGDAVVIDPAELGAFVAAYKVKYDWDMSGNEGPIFAVAPRVAFAFAEFPEKAPGRPTRWHFAR